MDVTYERQAILSKAADNYKNIGVYFKKPRRMNFVQFDYAVVHDMALFRLEPDLSFEDMERRIDGILKALPAVKRIFAQPIIHLKEHDVMLPVEAVRVVNNNSLTHIASHSELWSDVNSDGIKPIKLLTRAYNDNYGIYENMVFCNVVDDVLAFARNHIRFLRELIYTNRTIEINLLERVNHLNYFLAVGKLHIGYNKNFDAYSAVAERCLNKLLFIVNSIVPRLKRPVYKNNKARPANIKIRKTNVLSMDKQYHQVYKLAKSFENSANAVKNITDKDIAELENSYFLFCQTLLLFAVSHFNFACDKIKTFDLRQLKLSFAFKNWTLKLERQSVDGISAISIELDKDKPYKILLIPSLESSGAETLGNVKAAAQADEYIVCSPFEDCENDMVFIDITSIESFRRLQQIILRGMIYADTKRTDCPFCNNTLTANAETADSENTVYECISCRTEIHEKRCPETGDTYFCTAISGLKPYRWGKNDSWLAKRGAEGLMYYRNITDINENAEPVCPKCGKPHLLSFE